MTANQIAYWKNQYDDRHNRAVEAEQRRSNLANEAIRAQTNAQNLQLGVGNLEETKRANLAREREAHRANKEGEQIKRDTNTIQARNADTNAYNAMVNYSNAQTNMGSLAELRRANQAKETLGLSTLAEQERANKAREEETNRSNIQQENIARFRSATDYQTTSDRNTLQKVNQQETKRHNQATELETKRKNLIDQQLEAAGLTHRIQNDAHQRYAEYMRNVTQSLPKPRLGGK